MSIGNSDWKGTVETFFKRFQEELELDCLRFKLAAAERIYGYPREECCQALYQIFDALEQKGRSAEALELIERAGRIVTKGKGSSRRMSMLMDLLLRKPVTG
jgi:hypothetical protein